LFGTHCALCHRFRGDGIDIGPDLGALVNKSVPVLLTAILDPNQAVEWRYVTYTATTADGRELGGVMVSETPGSFTLRTAGGQDETLLRNAVTRLDSSKLSMMPEGLEHALTPQDMADLIEYILAPPR
jgi:putative heme-binding domain-containing protein